MSKFIAVCGSPESGKTVTSIKLAQQIYAVTKKKIIVFSPDLTAPLLGYVFPHYKDTDLYSVGKALDHTDIFKEDVLRRIVTVKNMTDMGFLGFKAGENKYTYPRPTEDKIAELFACLRSMADYVIVDCVSDNADLISSMAKSEADIIVRLVTADLKTMTYYASHKDEYNAIKDKTVTVMNCKEKEMHLPSNDVLSCFKDTKYKLPYSFALNKQTYTGMLINTLKDNAYKKEISALCKAVV